ncbi:MarR family winged helix-turn-helix transcriptional regulator [Streptomyces bacillaris]|uniref:MarR family transcriptional regulator n=1 Tax=Streptomyces cavourensis TaxID=67258 RepID=A0AAD0Q6Y4_9ACTN|nr:MarR family transcriptional regulator [Streptomyces cavourensis]ATY97156.1 transcriptional regulator [Streptomyces cavourensis]AXI72999.1 MarR family transcriptional regulator [Streptomyces cavourensis]MBH0243963.1 MarR family transcriptional regulator [Streptomyces cavourensis]UTR77307.1 MarR family transcriptional regulator [Streptomyces cavourensis]WAE67564.1 MarR family transcriptional regulator [Streptomyces cavourensis]
MTIVRGEPDATQNPVSVTEATAEVPGVLPEALTGFIGYLLRRVFAQFTTYADGPEDDSRDFLVLDALTGGDWVSQLDLAERLGINRTIMVGVIDRLESRGQVLRTRNPDNRRQYILSLTDRGRAAVETGRRAVAERDARLTAALSAEQVGRLNTLLARLLPEGSQELVQGTEHLVEQAHHRLRRLGDEKLAGTGLRVRHYGPLSVLAASGPCPQQRLARELAITGPATSQLVDELVEGGMVVRGRDPHDRRRHALELTELGHARLKEVAEAVDLLAADVAELLGPGGEDELRALLVQLLEPAHPGVSEAAGRLV